MFSASAGRNCVLISLENSPEELSTSEEGFFFILILGGQLCKSLSFIHGSVTFKMQIPSHPPHPCWCISFEVSLELLRGHPQWVHCDLPACKRVPCTSSGGFSWALLSRRSLQRAFGLYGKRRKRENEGQQVHYSMQIYTFLCLALVLLLGLMFLLSQGFPILKHITDPYLPSAESVLWQWSV